jgi:heme exporter protein C
MDLNLNKDSAVLHPKADKAFGNPLVSKVLFGGTIVTMLVSIYLIFMYANIEKFMGVVQKIFYIHVSTAWIAFLAFFVTFVFSILFLWKRERIYDTYAYISAEIGVLFTTVVLTTGPIWAKSSWNVWWAWEPRLTTTLILWFIYIAYIMIRQMDGAWDKKARLCAVFGIIGFADVPIVWFAIRWWNTKFHPVVFGEGKDQSGGGIDDTMLVALLASITAMTFLYAFLLHKGVIIENMKIKVTQYKEKIREAIEN